MANGVELQKNTYDVLIYFLAYEGIGEERMKSASSIGKEVRALRSHLLWILLNCIDLSVGAGDENKHADGLKSLQTFTTEVVEVGKRLFS